MLHASKGIRIEKRRQHFAMEGHVRAINHEDKQFCSENVRIDVNTKKWKQQQQQQPFKSNRAHIITREKMNENNKIKRWFPTCR